MPKARKTAPTREEFRKDNLRLRAENERLRCVNETLAELISRSVGHLRSAAVEMVKANDVLDQS